jgi:hypothetical protein
MTDFKIDGFKLRGDLKLPQQKRTMRFLSFQKAVDIGEFANVLDVLNVEPASTEETKFAINDPSLLFHVQEDGTKKVIILSAKEDFYSMFVIDKGHVIEEHPRVLGGISPRWVVPVVSNW